VGLHETKGLSHPPFKRTFDLLGTLRVGFEGLPHEHLELFLGHILVVQRLSQLLKPANKVRVHAL
jgi:hypothetical protein